MCLQDNWHTHACKTVNTHIWTAKFSTVHSVMLLLHTAFAKRRVCVAPHAPHGSRGFSRRPQPLRAAGTAKQYSDTVQYVTDWQHSVDDDLGLAFRHALGALQWGAVCAHIASFAATLAGKRRCENPEIATNLDEAVVRLWCSDVHTEWCT